jgi:hypothetical protein
MERVGCARRMKIYQWFRLTHALGFDGWLSLGAAGGPTSAGGCLG